MILDLLRWLATAVVVAVVEVMVEEVATEVDEAVVVVATLLPTPHHLAEADGRVSLSTQGWQALFLLRIDTT